MHVKIFLSAYKIIIIILMIITIYTVYIFVNTIFASNFLFICQFLLINIQILHYHVKHVCFVGWHVIFHVCWKCNKLEMLYLTKTGNARHACSWSHHSNWIRMLESFISSLKTASKCSFMETVKWFFQSPISPEKHTFISLFFLNFKCLNFELRCILISYTRTFKILTSELQYLFWT